MKKFRTLKQEQYKKKISKRESRIELLKNIDLALSEVTFENFSLKNKSDHPYVQNRLDSIEKRLGHIKQEYSRALEVQKKKNLEEINDSKNEDKVKKLYEKFQAELEKQIYKIKVEIAHLKHNNKVTEDKLWWQMLTKEERKERRSDLSFYRPDVQGYWLTLLSVVAEIIYLILLLGIMDRAYWVGITILVNIVFLLFLFTIAIKVKNYKKLFGFCSIGFGFYCIVRLAWIIQGLMKVDLSGASSINQGFIYGSNIYMILISIYVGLRSLIKIKQQEIYIKEEKISKIQMSK